MNAIIELSTGYENLLNICYHFDEKSITWTHLYCSRDLGWVLPNKTHVKFHVMLQGFPNMASDWLAAVHVLPANKFEKVWKSLLTNMDVNMDNS